MITHEEKLVNDPQKPVVKAAFPGLFQVLMFTESAISKVPSVLGQNRRFVEKIGLLARAIEFVDSTGGSTLNGTAVENSKIVFAAI